MVLSLLTVFLTFLFVNNTYAQPTATAATNIGSTTFRANWNAVSGASSYYLDVSTTPFNNVNLVGWTFPNTNSYNLESVSANITSANNTNQSFVSYQRFSVVDNKAVVGIQNGSVPFWEISVNTIGNSNVWVRSVQTSTNRGPRYFRLQYNITTDNNNWVFFGSRIDVNANAGAVNVELPAPCNNKTNVKIRWIMDGTVSAGGDQVNPSGSTTIDDIYVYSQNSATYVQPYQNFNVGNVTSETIDNILPITTNPAIAPLTTYYYRVRAVVDGTTGNSNVIQVKTYKDISTADFRSRANGNYDAATTWEFDSGIPEVGWVPATQPPGDNNNVLIQTPHTVTMTAAALFNSGKTLTVNGTLATATHSITGAGSITVPSGGVVASGNLSATDAFAGSLAVTGTIDFQTGSTFELNGTAKQYLGARTFSNLKISNTSGVKALGDLTVDGELSLATNPNDTDGALDMVIDYGPYATNKYGDNTNGDFRNITLPFNNLNSYVLTMGATATTVGMGDVTGKIRRGPIADNTTYTFGNANTQLRFTSVSGSALPSQITVVATRGNHGTHIDNTGGVLINGYTAIVIP